MRGLIIAAVLVAVNAASEATAAPIHYSVLFAGVTAHPSGQTDVESDLVYGAMDLGPFTGALQGGYASASVIDGKPQAYATGIDDRTSATAQAGFFDTLLLTSDLLQAGTAVQLLAQVSLHATISGHCGIGTAGVYGGLGGSGGELFLDNYACGQSTTVGSVLLNGLIGQELTLHAYLNAAVGGVSGTADASSISVVLTPMDAFSYSTSSGLTYSAAAPPPPLPEPSTVLLLGAGFAAAVRRRTRARDV